MDDSKQISVQTLTIQERISVLQRKMNWQYALLASIVIMGFEISIFLLQDTTMNRSAPLELIGPSPWQTWTDMKMGRPPSPFPLTDKLWLRGVMTTPSNYGEYPMEG